VTGNHGNTDAWVAKLDNTGTIQWQRCYGGSKSDEGLNILTTKDSGYVLLASTYSNDGDVVGYHDSADIWVLKLDHSGGISWQRCLGGSSGETAYGITGTKDGGYLVAGGTSSHDGDITYNHGKSDAWLVKLNTDGTISWQKTYGGSSVDGAWSVQQTSDSGYIVAGSTLSTDGDVSGLHAGTPQLADYWLFKVNATGSLQWQKCLGGSSSDGAYAVLQTSDSEYVVAGQSASIDGDVTGHHGTLNNDYWAVKLVDRDSTTGVSIIGDHGLQIYPTIGNGIIHVALANQEQAYMISVVNLYGETMQRIATSSSDNILDISGYPPGIYLVYIKSNNGTVVRKVVKR